MWKISLMALMLAGMQPAPATCPLLLLLTCHVRKESIWMPLYAMLAALSWGSSPMHQEARHGTKLSTEPERPQQSCHLVLCLMAIVFAEQRLHLLWCSDFGVPQPDNMCRNFARSGIVGVFSCRCSSVMTCMQSDPSTFDKDTHYLLAVTCKMHAPGWLDLQPYPSHTSLPHKL